MTEGAGMTGGGGNMTEGDGNDGRWGQYVSNIR